MIPYPTISCKVAAKTDTVGELKSVEICVSHMPSLKAKKLGKLPREKYSQNFEVDSPTVTRRWREIKYQ